MLKIFSLANRKKLFLVTLLLIGICLYVMLIRFPVQLSYISTIIMGTEDEIMGTFGHEDAKFVDFWSKDFKYETIDRTAGDLIFYKYQDSNTIIIKSHLECNSTIIDDVDPEKVAFTKTGYAGAYIYEGISYSYVCGSIKRTSGTTKSDTPQIMAPSIKTPNPVATWETHIISDANLTFATPNEMQVISETHKNSETGIVYSITLYVEKKNNVTGSNYYQLYGLYQLEGKYSQDSLNAYKVDLEPASIKDTTIAGFSAAEGQVKGQRNRFVTYILTNKGLFSLYTTEPTAENKKLTDQILATFKFTN